MLPWLLVFGTQPTLEAYRLTPWVRVQRRWCVLLSTQYRPPISHFWHQFFCLKVRMICDLQLRLKESFGPRKENNSLKGPLLNHLTSGKTKHIFSSILMLQASCIYLGLISPCPESYHPLHPPRRLITPCPTASVISTEEYSKYPSWLTFPLSLPQTSL